MAKVPGNDPLFQKMISDAMPDAVVANLIIVAEVVTESGTDLQVLLSDGVTPWLATGMLEYASEMLYTGQQDFRSMEDDDEE